MHFAISLLSPLGKGRGSSFEQTLIPIIQQCFVQSLIEIGPVVLGKKILKFRQYIFSFVIISPSKRVWTFIGTKFNSHHQRMLCAKFGYNWLTGSGEEIFVNVLSLFRNYPPLIKGVTLNLKNLVEIGPVF